LLFCGCSPAYFVPAVPLGLKAEPGADAALPGVLGALADPQEALGWPNARVWPDGVVGCVAGVPAAGVDPGPCGAPPPPACAAAKASPVLAHSAKAPAKTPEWMRFMSSLLFSQLEQLTRPTRQATRSSSTRFQHARADAARYDHNV